MGDGLLVLLKVEADKGDGDKFPDLATSPIPDKYEYELFNFNRKGKKKISSHTGIALSVPASYCSHSYSTHLQFK